MGWQKRYRECLTRHMCVTTSIFTVGMFQTVAHQVFGHGHNRREYAQQVAHYGQHVELSVGVGDFSKLTLVSTVG
jgi:hypothetical protein